MMFTDSDQNLEQIWKELKSQLDTIVELLTFSDIVMH